MSLAYGANEADEFENMLNDLDERTKLVSELIGTTCKIDVTELMYYEGIEIDLAGAPSKVEKQPAWFPEEDVPYEHWQCYISDEDLAHWTAVQEGSRKQEALEQQQRDAAPRIYYCNTTGKWYTTLKASDTASKWNDALEHQSKLDGKNYEQWNASSPFGRHTAGKGAQLDPDAEWTTRYMGTSDVKKMQERLRGDATLKSELEEVGFSTAKYLITSEKFTKGGWRNDNCWKMDTSRSPRLPARRRTAVSPRTRSTSRACSQGTSSGIPTLPICSCSRSPTPRPKARPSAACVRTAQFRLWGDVSTLEGCARTGRRRSRLDGFDAADIPRPADRGARVVWVLRSRRLPNARMKCASVR